MPFAGKVTTHQSCGGCGCLINQQSIGKTKAGISTGLMELPTLTSQRIYADLLAYTKRYFLA